MSRRSAESPARQRLDAGLALIGQNPILNRLRENVHIMPDTQLRHVGEKGWLAISPHGYIYVHPKRVAEPAEWARVIATGLICLGFGAVRETRPQEIWEGAALLSALRFCDELKIGTLPETLTPPEVVWRDGGEDGLFRKLMTEELPNGFSEWRDHWCGKGRHCFIDLESKTPLYRKPVDWKSLLADGIAQGVGRALRIVAGEQDPDEDKPRKLTGGQKAKRRIIDCYPLLGGMAAGFDLVEDARECHRYDVQVAMIDVGAMKIWINPSAHLSESETLFVYAHELLHAGLNHMSRRRGRDPFLWNAACDFVINAWLIDMGLGSPPTIGLLHDPAYQGLSAESIYDILTKDIRKARKLATLRGVGATDMTGTTDGKMFTDGEEFCRRALTQGLDRCLYGPKGRGTLPAGLIEEIRSLSQPPIPWDVQLAEWFDEHFPALEYRRSYARPSRRQSSTPDIPRPSRVPPPEEERQSRVFAVVLDTSGSMEPRLLGKALGTIASYSLTRDVFAVRLICCDATAYDSGWVRPEQIIERFTIKGRGGTVLQPGIDCLDRLVRAGEYPRTGPLLIITDTGCESTLDVPFEHAYLIPEGLRLPFQTRAKCFEVK